MTGALLNVATVLVGGTAGLALKTRLPPAAQRVGLRLLGLLTLVLGTMMLFETKRPWLLVVALAAGIATGTLLRLQHRLERGARWIQDRIARPGESTPVAEGFITTSLLFCVGPMTIVGSIQDGLTGHYEIIAIKALMDGVAALAFASTLGWGVLLSAGTVLIVQGGITLGAQALRGVLTDPLVTECTAAGGALVLCIGVGLLGWKKLSVADYLPALLYAPLLARFW